MLHQTRSERTAASRTWDRAFAPLYQRAVAETLITCVAELENPTLGDVLAWVGEGAYDPTDPLAVLLQIGSLVGRPGEGPTVGEIVAVLEELEPVKFDIAIGRRLLDLLVT